MKWLSNSVVVIGLLICAFAVVGRFSASPGSVMGIKTMNLLLLANTLFLFSIIVKDFGKK